MVHYNRQEKYVLSTTNAITTAPIDSSLARMVKSKSNPCHPHLVQMFQDGKVTCDENYLMQTSLNIYFHCVAVAQCLNITDGYISWYITNREQPDLTKLTSCFGQNLGKKANTKQPFTKRLSLLSQVTRCIQDCPLRQFV